MSNDIRNSSINQTVGIRSQLLTDILNFGLHSIWQHSKPKRRKRSMPPMMAIAAGRRANGRAVTSASGPR